ncbi:28S ribosomal protein S27, mitochondrial isoform X4 [Neoarius graeffei]|uniref:28S ribosomal protein S27, mitochondrial isoform X4 n=1 Tax=Neoarius graeffei TaxID=443677 RepID=UPI00298CF1B1|nr:28S ribosomal protein S27, mitochondrial isoform X4 [Neoarius graeffei]
MAASILQRFSLSPCLNGRRCLLSAAYTDTRVWEQRQHNPQNLAKLASLMDKTYEKKLPVSSLTISRFVDSISSREEVDQAEYYLYKFRHSPNCWYLRDWTIHSWFRQCVKYGARDRALYTLKNKWQEERNMGAAFLLAGLKQENDVGLNAQLLGHALIGKVEMARGIHAVFHNMPLMWTPGYLSKGLVVMEQVCNDAGDLKLCKEILDYMQMILQELVSMLASEATVQKDAENQAVTIDEDDELERAKLPQYSARFKELKEQLYSQGKVEMRSLNTLVSILAEEKLRTCEEQDMAQYEKTMQAWEAERIQLLQREAMIRKKAEQERLAKKTAQAIQ